MEIATIGTPATTVDTNIKDKNKDTEATKDKAVLDNHLALDDAIPLLFERREVKKASFFGKEKVDTKPLGAAPISLEFVNGDSLQVARVSKLNTETNTLEYQMAWKIIQNKPNEDGVPEPIGTNDIDAKIEHPWIFVNSNGLVQTYKPVENRELSKNEEKEISSWILLINPEEILMDDVEFTPNSYGKLLLLQDLGRSLTDVSRLNVPLADVEDASKAAELARLKEKSDPYEQAYKESLAELAKVRETLKQNLEQFEKTKDEPKQKNDTSEIEILKLKKYEEEFVKLVKIRESEFKDIHDIYVQRREEHNTLQQKYEHNVTATDIKNALDELKTLDSTSLDYQAKLGRINNLREIFMPTVNSFDDLTSLYDTDDLVKTFGENYQPWLKGIYTACATVGTDLKSWNRRDLLASMHNPITDQFLSDQEVEKVLKFVTEKGICMQVDVSVDGKEIATNPVVAKKISELPKE